ncbi:MAG: response regulator [Anaerolineae bacterium]|nr:response regulator [Anaerolineae bacterium]
MRVKVSGSKSSKTGAYPSRFGLILAILVALSYSPITATATHIFHRTPGAAIRFAHLTTEDGLSQSTVRIILQDRAGFLWFGTEGGLNRFDGYAFTIYQHDPRNSNSLSDDYVMDLYEDADGMLWIATQGGGVNRFDPRTETFTRYRHDPDNPNSLAGNTIFSIFQDSAGDLWFGGPRALGGLTRFDPITGTFTRYSANPDDAPGPFQGGAVWDVVEVEGGQLWLAADSVLAQFDPETEAFTYYAPDTEDNRLAALLQDEVGMLWVGGMEGLYQFDPQSGTFDLYQPDDPILVTDLLPNEDGMFWISTHEDGLYLFDPETGQFTDHYTHDSAYEPSLSHDRVQNLFRDQGGLLWIGTSDGVDQYDPRQAQFTYYRHDPENAYSLADGTVWGIAGDQQTPSGGNLWVGAGAALNQLDLVTGRVVRHPLEGLDPSSVGDGRGAIFFDQDTVWAGKGAILYRFETAGGEFSTYNLQALLAPGSPPMSITSFYRDGSTLWIGALRGGLIRFDVQNEAFEVHRRPSPEARTELDTRFFLNYEVGALYGDRDGSVWIGYTSGALSRFDPSIGSGGDAFRHYVPREDDPTTIPSGTITGIYQDQTGTLWLTSRRGLTRFDPHEETFTLYTERDGLLSSYVTGIQEDHDGNLWLATTKGLSRFDLQAEAFHNYGVADGVGSTEFTGASWQAADGRLFFGGQEGLTVFYPDQISDSRYEPPVVLTGLYLFNQLVQIDEGGLIEQPIWQTDHLTLRHDQAFISFEFAALSYAAPQENHYRYRLEGLEETWNEVDSRHRLATYTHLPAGDYVFRVQGTNDDGVWSSDEVALPVTVLPPWWETTWFRLALLLLGTAGITGAVRWRMHALRQRSRVLEREVARQTEQIRDQHRFLQTVLDSLAHPFYVIHAETRVVEMANAAARAGDLSTGIACHLLTHGVEEPCEGAEHPCPLEEVKQTKKPVVVEHVHVDTEGRRQNVEIHAFPILDRDGTVVQMVEYAVDVTERKRIEAQSQRLAVMEERERIGRELHDDLGQVMGYVSIQSQSALERLRQRELEQVQAILHQLTQVASEAHDDVRQYILGVRTRPARPRQDLFTALGEYLDSQHERYGLTVQVSWPDDLMESPLAPEVETQLLRIVQEALTNVRKHAGVDTARILFTVHSHEIQVVVEDDGSGFDPARDSELSNHFGLQIMRERAESVGGELEVRSAPGEGTRIVVRLPCSLLPSPDDPFGRGLRVLLVDDHPLYLEGLHSLLASRGVHVVGEAYDGLEAQAKARALRPDLILMDVQMPRCDGVEATRCIKAELPQVQIVMLTMAADDETLFDALKAGASGYLLKNLEGAQFFSLLRQVMKGETVISPALASRVLAEFAQPGDVAEEKKPILTARQREVLELVAQGLTNKEIAVRLHVTEQTIKYHVSQILERLQLKSRHQLAHYADDA